MQGKRLPWPSVNAVAKILYLQFTADFPCWTSRLSSDCMESRVQDPGGPEKTPGWFQGIRSSHSAEPSTPPCKPRANIPEKAPASGCQIVRSALRVIKQLPRAATRCRPARQVRAPWSQISFNNLLPAGFLFLEGARPNISFVICWIPSLDWGGT